MVGSFLVLFFLGWAITIVSIYYLYNEYLNDNDDNDISGI